MSIHVLALFPVSSYLDWRGWGFVFYLRRWMVCDRWSIQNILHKNIQWFGGAKTDGVFTGADTTLYTHRTFSSCIQFTILFFLSPIRLFYLLIIQVRLHPSTRSSKFICLSDLICGRSANLKEQLPTQKPSVRPTQYLCVCLWLL